MDFADLTINDGKATPTAHTFTKRRLDAGVAKWQDISGGIPIAYPTLTASLKEPSPNAKLNRKYRGSVRVVVPITATVDGIVTKVDECAVFIDFTSPEDSTEAVRSDALAYAMNAMANAVIKPMATKLDTVV